MNRQGNNISHLRSITVFLGSYRFNSISRIDDSSLTGLQKVELLMLHSNDIHHLPDGVFRDMKSLQVNRKNFNIHMITVNLNPMNPNHTLWEGAGTCWHLSENKWCDLWKTFNLEFLIMIPDWLEQYRPTLLGCSELALAKENKTFSLKYVSVNEGTNVDSHI